MQRSCHVSRRELKVHGRKPFGGYGGLFFRRYQDHNRLAAVRCLPWLVRPRTLSGGPLMKSITNAYTKRGVNPNVIQLRFTWEKAAHGNERGFLHF